MTMVISTRDSQAIAIVERMHQTISKIIQQMDLDNENPWEGTL